MRDPLVVSWPAGIAAHGELRHGFAHVSDLVPTLLELIGVEPPSEVGVRYGYATLVFSASPGRRRATSTDLEKVRPSSVERATWRYCLLEPPASSGYWLRSFHDSRTLPSSRRQSAAGELGARIEVFSGSDQLSPRSLENVS